MLHLYHKHGEIYNIYLLIVTWLAGNRLLPSLAFLYEKDSIPDVKGRVLNLRNIHTWVIAWMYVTMCNSYMYASVHIQAISNLQMKQ